jgi:uracil-DNA glycosylase family 4
MEVPDPACGLCPRLAAFRAANAERFPGWHNAPVPAFGPLDAKLLIVGLAPGLRGANRSGRPFTGDHAGHLLYATLLKYGFARGRYSGLADGDIALVGCRITNAVRCVPPENRPLREEFRACARFLRAEIAAMSLLRAVVALGALAHAAVLAALDCRPSAYPFGHGRVHAPEARPLVADSYHCSRQNTNTGRLTPAMFEAVFARMQERCRD